MYELVRLTAWTVCLIVALIAWYRFAVPLGREKDIFQPDLYRPPDGL